MRRTLQLAIAATVLVTGPALAQQDLSDVEIQPTQIADGLFMLTGSGGNIGLSVGGDGTFVVAEWGQTFMGPETFTRLAYQSLSD